jgi:hypothetical protein
LTRTIGFVLCGIVAAILTLMILLGGPQMASPSDPSPSASPSASPSPSATAEPPASAELVKRALRVRRSAVRIWRQWNRARRCFELERRPFASPKPRRSATAATWTAALKGWRSKRADLRGRVHRLVWRMRHPSGAASGAKWWPAARWCGWPESLKGWFCYVVMRESSARKWAVNASSGCFGLLQLHPCHWAAKGLAWIRDVFHQLRLGWRLYRECGASPWAVS